MVAQRDRTAESLGRQAAPGMFELWKRIQEKRGIAPHPFKLNVVYKKQCVDHVLTGPEGQQLSKPCPHDVEHHDARMVHWRDLKDDDREQFEALAMIVAKEVEERLR